MIITEAQLIHALIGCKLYNSEKILDESSAKYIAHQVWAVLLVHHT